MRFVFDLDGTLCTWDRSGEYQNAEPHPERIERVNELHRSGHEVVICTARGAGTGKDWSEVTAGQLERWGVRYDELSFRKEHADLYVDDRAISPEAFFGG